MRRHHLLREGSAGDHKTQNNSAQQHRAASFNTNHKEAQNSDFPMAPLWQ